MSDTIIINDKTYHAIRCATDAVSYSADYVTRLAREKKILAVQLGRRWYVHIDSLQAYAAVQQQEQTIRQKHLRAERQRERETRSRSRTVRPILNETVVLAGVALVLMAGITLGAQLQPSAPAVPQVALTKQAVSQKSFVTAPAETLRPVFTNDQSVIHVAPGRTVERSATDQWVTVQYE